MLVTVTTGLTPLQFAFGQPATAPPTVSGAESTAGFVVNGVRPFLIALAGMDVVEVAGPTRTLFCPGAMFPPPFWHWYRAKPDVLRSRTRSTLPRPASSPEQVTLCEVSVAVTTGVIVQVGTPPCVKCSPEANAGAAKTTKNSSGAQSSTSSRFMVPSIRCTGRTRCESETSKSIYVRVRGTTVPNGLPHAQEAPGVTFSRPPVDRKSTRLNSSHVEISYAVFCLKKKKKKKLFYLFKKKKKKINKKKKNNNEK